MNMLVNQNKAPCSLMHQAPATDRIFATKELAKLLGVLAHPERILIVEELRNREMDVNSLQAVLGVSHSRVSQNLAILRSHRIVMERREGRHVFYRLIQNALAGWLLQGLEFLERGAAMSEETRDVLGRARLSWMSAAAGAENGAVTLKYSADPADDQKSI